MTTPQGNEVGPAPATEPCALPPEILEVIFSLAAAPSLDDMRELINSNPVWKRILHSQRKLWLFPKVFPFLTKYLNRKDVLSCRLVSGHWRQGVGEFIEGAEHLAPYKKGQPGDRDMNRVPVWRQTDYNFPCWIPRRGQIRYLEEGDGGDQPNLPFVGREMGIKERPSLAQPICQLVGNILPVYGLRISYLFVELPGQLKCSQMTDLLEVIVQNAPNLRQLRLAGGRPRCSNFCNMDPNVVDVGACSNPLVGTLPSHLRRLRTLQLAIKFSDQDDHRLTLENVLIRSHSELLGRLEVTTWDSNSWPTLVWSNLKELHLPTQTPTTGEKDILSSLAKLNAPNLAKLILSFPGENSDCPQQVFQVLQSFPGLHYLGMLFKHRYLGGDMFWVKLEQVLEANGAIFPSIKVVQVGHPPIHLQLLLHFPEIECIKIMEAKEPLHCVHYQIYDVVALEQRGYDYHGGLGMSWGETDEYLSYSKTCYDRQCCRSEDLGKLIFPDFWMLLPRLSMLVARGGIYSREGFEKYAQRFQSLVIGRSPSVLVSLLQLCLPNVTQVELQCSERQLRRDSCQKLLKLLANFPNLEGLEINCPSFISSVVLMHLAPPLPRNQIQGQGHFPSVEHLKVHQLPISRDFLRRFPNLEWLEFVSGPGGCHRVFCREWQDPIIFGSYDPRSYVLQGWRTHRLKRVYESEIWDMFPFLKGFRVTGGEVGGWNEEYTREGREDFLRKRFGCDA